jgi:hypothetical protein
MIPEKNLKQKILRHCPFKAKHQRTQEYLDVTLQNLIKILSLDTIPLQTNKEIYKNLFFNIEYLENQLSLFPF